MNEGRQLIIYYPVRSSFHITIAFLWKAQFIWSWVNAWENGLVSLQKWSWHPFHIWPKQETHLWGSVVVEWRALQHAGAMHPSIYFALCAPLCSHIHHQRNHEWRWAEIDEGGSQKQHSTTTTAIECSRYPLLMPPCALCRILTEKLFNSLRLTILLLNRSWLCIVYSFVILVGAYLFNKLCME